MNTNAQNTVKPHSEWTFAERLLLGKSIGGYARGLLTPFNVVLGTIILIGLPFILLRFIKGLAAVTPASNEYPWGILLGWGLFAGVPLSATGFLMATTVYVFGMKKYHVLVRPAVLTGLLGYFFAVIYLNIDLGRPWRLPFPMFVSYGPTSVLFLVAWHVALYLAVQLLEFSPAILEWIKARRVRRWAMMLTVGATIFGVILSTLHQSALGGMFLLAPGKVHPLWYSPYLPVFFFVSAIFAGLSMIIAVSTIDSRFLRAYADEHYLNSVDELTLGLGKAAAITLVTYFGLKWIGVAHSNSWSLLGTSGYGKLFLLEIFGAVLLPAILYTVGVKNKNVGLVRFTAFLTIVGNIFNRLMVSNFAFNWWFPHVELPTARELIMIAAIICIHILTYRWIVIRMPVLREEPEVEHMVNAPAAARVGSFPQNLAGERAREAFEAAPGGENA
ncbi:MAG: NrfD/PsrC family molybdoenzyme membrane anchor subunit [Candidatus Methylomirabilia bacterium]